MSRHIADQPQWDDDDQSTMPCPYCGREIYEDSPRCPYCEQYISDEDAPLRSRPWWIVLGVLLCLLVIWLWIAQKP